MAFASDILSSDAKSTHETTMRTMVHNSLLATGALLNLVACGGGGDTQPASVAVTVSWSVPSFNIDGSPLTDVAGYRVYYGTEPRNWAVHWVLVMGGSVTSTTINGLTPGTYYFAVATVNSKGFESSPTGVVSGHTP